MRNSNVVFTLCLALLLTVPGPAALALDLPAPPAGYTWQECPDIKGALLVPAGWHFKRLEDVEKVKLSYFITPMKWEPPQQITHGMTFNILREVPGGSPKKFAKQYVTEMAASTGSTQTWNTDTGSFTGHGIIYSDGASQIFNLILANEETGTAFLVTFESPLQKWKAAWAEIQPVVRQLMIDDTV
ncbi:MAG: hypothetical protein AAGM22_26035 [Acidobacteriota bacterium]